MAIHKDRHIPESSIFFARRSRIVLMPGITEDAGLIHDHERLDGVAEGTDFQSGDAVIKSAAGFATRFNRLNQ